MVICFGISWPASIVRSWRARTCKGKSLFFLIFILVGYICGVSAKLVSQNITYVFVFYCLNLVMVATDMVLYYRNWRMDQARERGELKD